MPSKARKKKTETEVLHVEGELTVFRTAELKAQILGPTPAAAIDLSGVTEIDTAGLQLLLLARQTAMAQRRTLRLLAPSPAVREVIALLNVGTYLDMVPAAAPAGV